MPTETAPSEAGGFTLIEMLAVLAIMAVLAAVAVGYLDRRPARIDRDELTLTVADALEAARDEARRNGTRVVLALPNRAKDGVTFKAAIAEADGAIAFYPDGSSTGGEILQGGRTLIRVDWLTGAIHGG